MPVRHTNSEGRSDEPHVRLQYYDERGIMLKNYIIESGQLDEITFDQEELAYGRRRPDKVIFSGKVLCELVPEEKEMIKTFVVYVVSVRMDNDHTYNVDVAATSKQGAMKAALRVVRDQYGIPMTAELKAMGAKATGHVYVAEGED